VRTLAAVGRQQAAHHYGRAMNSAESPRDQATIAVTAGRPERTPDAPLNTPIVPASAFVAGGPTEYAREGGPTIAAFEALLAALEGTPESAPAIAVAFSSGMAAADAVLDTVPIGGRVIAPTTTYTGVAVRLRELRDRGAIDLQLVDITNTDAVTAATASGADLLWLESPTNPLLEQADLATLLAHARDADIRTVVDNTFATPILQQPLHLGADVVLHSATKGLSGHSDLLLGALVTTDDQLAETLRTRRILLGASPSAFDAFLATRGMRTLAVRMTKAHASAAYLADQLSTEPKVSRVRAFGSMITMEFGGDADRAQRVCEATSIWVHATSLGGVESSLERRRRWPLEADHVPEDLVRASVGIEDAEDLWRDLAHAIQNS
jgi:cystathionine gamma-synthase